MSLRNLSLMEKSAVGACIAVIFVALASCGMTLTLGSRPADARPVAQRGQTADEEYASAPSPHAAYGSPLPAEPVFTNAASTMLHDSDEVIGFLVNNKPYAFPQQPMRALHRHIINLNIDGTPVSVTYCDMVDHARVLCRAQGAAPFELQLGGVTEDYEMVFLLDGARYAQSAPELPLDDIPFERTTLADWIARHPESMIYEG